MRLRRAEAADAVEIAGCIEAAYAVYRAAGIALPPVSDGVAEDIRDNRVWVAQEQGIVGVLIAVPGAEGWHLANLAVHPAYHRRGIARLLLDRMAGAARQAGVFDLVLTTHVRMPDNVALYTRLGWYETGREGDKVFMTRHLDGAQEG